MGRKMRHEPGYLPRRDSHPIGVRGKGFDDRPGAITSTHTNWICESRAVTRAIATTEITPFLSSFRRARPPDLRSRLWFLALQVIHVVIVRHLIYRAISTDANYDLQYHNLLFPLPLVFYTGSPFPR